jgi:type I restriction enzyme S subunit
MLKAAPPAGWEKTSLNHVAEVQTGIAKGKVINGATVTLPYLRVANVQDGHVDLSVMKEITLKPSEVDRYSLRKGDVLFTEGGDFDKLGRGTVWNGEIEPCLHQNHVFAVRPNPDRLLPQFLAYQAASQYGRRYFQLSSKQSTNLASINSTQLKQFPVLLPPLPEQRKIAEILRTWDLGVEKLEALRAAKEQQLEGFAAQLIHKAQAEQQYLREHLTEVSERNRGQCVARVLSVTNSAGFVPAEDQFAHRIASADISNYKIVRQGQYAYNPSRINVGSIARLDDWSEGALSPMYVVFELHETLDSDYFSHWLRTGEARKRIGLAAQGSVRDTVSFGDLSSIPVPIPPLEAQQQIARALSSAKKELSLLKSEIDLLTRQKRGLMQKLLTGEWRVQVEEAA